VGYIKLHMEFCYERHTGTDHLGDSVTNNMVILKWITEKQVLNIWTGTCDEHF
jgi:hypothetical protein